MEIRNCSACNMPNCNSRNLSAKEGCLLDKIEKKTDKTIDIYTLAEGPTFWAVICNYLGWAPTCTYGYDIMKPRRVDPKVERLDMLARVKGMGATITVHHLFEPFREPEIKHCQRKHIDDALTLIRLIIKSGINVVWDILPSEREFLLRYSPPLYWRMFSDIKPNKQD